MVFSVRVLSSTCLTRLFNTFDGIPTSRSVRHHAMHTLFDYRKMTLRNSQIMPMDTQGIVLIEVRRDIKTFIGNSRCLIGQLKRRDQDLPLTDTERTNRNGFPSCGTVDLVKKLHARHTSGCLFADIRIAEPLSQTKFQDRIPPKVIPFFEISIVVAVSVFLQQIPKGTPEIGITTLFDRLA